jgi:CBS domain-containing protein
MKARQILTLPGDTWSTAGEIMVRRLHTARPDQRVREVADMLLKYKVSGAPVVTEGAILVGVVSEKDCIKALLRAVHHRVPFSLVSDVMTTELITIGEDTHIMAMAELFIQHGIRRLPVVRDGRLVGQVSRRDVIRAASELFRQAPSRDAVLLHLSALGSEPPTV